MAADAQAPCIGSPSAAVVLTMHDKQVLVFHEEELQLPVPFSCWEIIQTANTFFISDTLMQDSSNSIANAPELQQSCTKLLCLCLMK